MKWTDPQVEMLSRLWMGGMTAAQIAGALGEGLTRNAVIGKVHRLGLSGIEAIRAGRAMAALAGETKANAVAVGGRRKAATDDSTVTIEDLSAGMCRWPADEPNSREFRYCGQATTGARPYCEHHGKLAYQATRSLPRKTDRHSLFPVVIIETGKA